MPKLTTDEKTRLLESACFADCLPNDHWHPYEDLTHAGEVLDAMRAKGWEYSLQSYGSDIDAEFTRPLREDEEPQTENSQHWVKCWLDTSDTADICNAALLALGLAGEDEL